MSDLPALLPRRNDDDDDSEHDMSDLPALLPQRNDDDDDDSDTDDDNEDNIEENPFEICALLNTLTLHDKDEEDILIDDLDDISIASEVEMEEETFTSKNSFYDLDHGGVKLVSFPDMKNKIEKNLTCKLCASQRRVGHVTVDQCTYKLATVITFTCNCGHDFSIAPKRIDEKK